MSTAELRKELHSYIEKADDKFLKMIHALAKSYEEKEDVGKEDYTLPGTPMDGETYRNRISRASDRAKAGHYTTSDDLDKEIEKW